MNMPKPTPSKPLTYTPPKFEKTNKPSELPAVEEPQFNIFEHILKTDPEFVNDLKQLGREIHGSQAYIEADLALTEKLFANRAKPEAPRTEKQGPMTHRPFQQFEGLRELQRNLNRGAK